ncbi:uncharacterized protein LOC135342231 [Halichondria panicea]|uniref:uncharacterized protein LOC135342231 n=1 Tax=Halichondria panicea TaxID=6063 RepID=UPI00312B89F1
MEYTRYLLCCLVLCLSSVPGGWSEDQEKGKAPVTEGKLPASSGDDTTLLSLKSLLIVVAVILVLAAGFLLYRYCRSARKKGTRMRYTRVKNSAGGDLERVAEDEYHDDQDEEETVYDKP